MTRVYVRGPLIKPVIEMLGMCIIEPSIKSPVGPARARSWGSINTKYIMVSGTTIILKIVMIINQVAVIFPVYIPL